MFSARASRILSRSLTLVLAIIMTLVVLMPGAIAAAAAPAAATTPALLAAPAAAFRVLVFSKTAGFTHSAIPTAKSAIQALGAENDFEVVVDDDAGRFTEAGLAEFDAVVFNSTTGDVLDPAQQSAFESYIGAGGGFVGLHSATDTEYDWDWYRQLVGGYFESHPAQQNATIKVEDQVHPSTSHLGDTWARFDEWYNIRAQDRDKIHVLLSLDEKSYTGGVDGADHPISWCQDFDGGRSWYTGLGHTEASYAEPDFLTHLLGGIETAAGVTSASCGASQSSSYELVPLDENTSNPMMLDVADDGTVFYAERDGRVQVIDSVTDQTTTALTLPVTTANEDGLLGIVLDPDFSTNGWIYAYWGPSTTGTDGPHNRLSRFDYNPTSRSASIASEKVLLKVTTQRNTCCHAGGDMVFDNVGNLVLVTGDNTNPFQSSGYAPIDEQAGREDFDAQRTSANTNDLRGKVLRVTPLTNGTYSVPPGNLFAAGTAQTRPEIYAMGFRNPFRVGVDQKTNNILVADYGPDAGAASSTRGPDGRVEWNLITQPGNYGWPYCHSDVCYNDYNFATSTAGALFNGAAVVNNSPNNTGLTNLPPHIAATIWYGYGTNPQFPEIGGGGAPMGGPVYRYDPSLDSDVKWPEYWDGKALFGEWNQGKMYSFQLDEQSGDSVVDINRLLPGIFDPSTGWSRSMDFDFGPDGALYIIDWGGGFGGNNGDSGVYKVNYLQGDPSPIARASADVTNGSGPLTVSFSSEGSRHPLAKPITLSWNFGDGSAPTSEANPTHVYTANGQYAAQLTVTDSTGKAAVANVTIVVGNKAPIVRIDFPDNGGFFEFGDQVRYEITVEDPDGVVDCARVTLNPALGHDSHAHPMEELSGCTGTFQTSRDDGHGAEANIFWAVDARYIDDGAAAGVPLTSYAQGVLQPKRLQSEFYTSTGRVGGTGGTSDGVRTETTGDTAGGGSNIGYIEPNDWWAHAPVSLLNIDTLTLRAANPNAIAAVSVRWNSPTGQEIGQIAVANTGAWQTYRDFSLTLDPATKPAGSGSLFFVLLNGGINVNWLEVSGAGVTSNVRPSLDLSGAPLSGAAPLIVDAVASATDPDGDSSAIAYSWNQGLGAGHEPGVATRTVTYSDPGEYRLTVRATDAAGAYAEKYVTVKVTAPPTGMCLAGRSDGFDTAAIDEDRWSTIIRRNQDISIQNGQLVIPASKTDIYSSGLGDVSNILLQNLPGGAWQATSKITLEARTQYQQAGLIVYGDDDNYAKMVLQGRDSGSSADNRIFQFIREEAGVPNEVAASNTAALGAGFPDTYYVRLASDGTTLTAAYSADGDTYVDMPQTKSLVGITNPKIGLTAFANSGSPAAVIDARFDWFSITPDDTAASATADDDFTGAALDYCRWEPVREDPTGYRVSGGALRIDTSPLDIYGAKQGATNLMLQGQPSGNWVVETKVDGSLLDRRYQQGGIILHADDDNYVKIDIVSTNLPTGAVTRNLELRNEIGGVVQDPQQNAPAPADGIVHLRLGKSGDLITGWYSADGTDWTQFAQALTNGALDIARVGVFALGSDLQTATGTAAFDYFRVVPPAPPLIIVGAIDPASPAASGWYIGQVALTLATTGGAGTIYREYNLDGVGWREYTAPVVVEEQGSHLVQYRASSVGGSTPVEELAFKIDSEAPVSSGTVNETARTVTLRGADAVSGLDRVEYSLDGGATWQTYAVTITVGPTATAVMFRAVDKAGNSEAANSAVVPSAGVELKVSTTAALPSSPTATFGMPTSIAVFVGGADGVPTGVVDITLGDVAVGSSALVNGRALVTIPGGVLSPGTNELSVRYAGDDEFAASSDVVTVTVTKAPSTTSAALTKGTIRHKERAQLQVTITSPAPVTGTVTVKNGTTVLAENVPVVNGAATITLPSLAKGTYLLTVHYSGSEGVMESSSATLTLKVK